MDYVKVELLVIDYWPVIEQFWIFIIILCDVKHCGNAKVSSTSFVSTLGDKRTT
jgi:hypothetical protein